MAPAGKKQIKPIKIEPDTEEESQSKDDEGKLWSNTNARIRILLETKQLIPLLPSQQKIQSLLFQIAGF